MKKNYFADNLKHLRKLKGLAQSEMHTDIGFTRTQWNGYENKKSFPKLEDFVKIAKYFDISETDLWHKDLTNVHLKAGGTYPKNAENVHLNVHPTVHLSSKIAAQNKDESLVNEEAVSYNSPTEMVQILSIAVKGLEAANAALLADNAELKVENSRLKREPPVIDQAMEGKTAQSA